MSNVKNDFYSSSITTTNSTTPPPTSTSTTITNNQEIMSTTTSASNFNTPTIQKECPNVDTFLYDPSNCDAGYWCGCSDPSGGKSCLPSNDTSETKWAGYYTDPNSGTVYTGWASIYPADYFECSDTLYCPGKDATDSSSSFCPQLCPTGSYCPNSTTILECPEGSFCLIGSVEPTSCIGLQNCQEQGIGIYKATYTVIMIAAITLAAYGYIYMSYRRLNGLFPFRYSTKKSTTSFHQNRQQVTPSNSNNGDDDENLPHGPVDLDAISSTRSSNITITGLDVSQRLNVSFDDLQLTLKNGKCIMQGVSGQLPAGQFTAIMGPSGAGKSTFLSLMSGKSVPTGGSLKINDKPASLKDYKSSVGFVPQEDIMLRELTVEENIKHSALMRLPSDWTHQQKIYRVYQVMESLDLLHIRDCVIGDEIRRGISAGQRKRVNVAMELAANPSLLFLDEPTSGLDSSSSSSLCDTLHALAQTGVNVAAVLHQPKYEIFEKFDNVLLLGVGGRTVYLGPSKDMVSYFTKIGFPLPPKTNPADYYMDVVAGLIPCQTNSNFQKEDLFEFWMNAFGNPHSEAAATLPTTIRSEMHQQAKGITAASNPAGHHQSRKTPGLFRQTYLLFQRATLQRKRQPQNTLYPIILSAFASSIIGLTAKGFGLDISADNNNPLYYGIPTTMTDPNMASSHFLQNYPISPIDNIVSLWLNTSLIIMLVSILSINVFGDEQAVFNRDVFSGMSPIAYWFSKTIETFLWLPIFAGIFVGISFLIQPVTISLPYYFGVVVVAFIGFYGIGMSLSLYINAKNRGISMLVVGLILILVFSGSLFPYNPSNPLFYLFFPFWTSQCYATQSYKAYEDAFDIELLNEMYANYDLSFSFGVNIACAFGTGMIWHFLALFKLIRTS